MKKSVGLALCNCAKGSSPKLVCAYHQWTYELDGRLLVARGMGEDFDSTQHGLKPFHCREASGLVFIGLATQAPDFDHHGNLWYLQGQEGVWKSPYGSQWGYFRERD